MGKTQAKPLIFINPSMVTKRQTPAAWPRFVVCARPRALGRATRRGRRGPVLSPPLPGEVGVLSLTSPWRGDAPTSVVQAVFLCCTNKTPHKPVCQILSWSFFLRGSRGFCPRPGVGVGGAAGGDSVWEKRVPRGGTGRSRTHAGPRGFLCAPRSDSPFFLSAECKPAACPFGHKTRKSMSSRGFLPFISAL